MQSKVARTISKARVAAALGLVTEDTSQFEVAAIFGAVIKDPIVSECALSIGFEEGTCVTVADTQDYAEIVEHMSPSEKSALRKRIGQ